MEDVNKRAKLSVLKSLMDFMDEKDLDNVKTKSPKFMKLETNDPEAAEEIIQTMQDQKPQEKVQDNPEMIEQPENSEMAEDDIERLKEMYSKIKMK